eukprot:TRINITY_DN1257_c0_g5_i1.p1 TRINITY_DN1257_c0_g5~~TRINITY_DN1257_c0_g5_i1.p1  ORF type:complete len:637 (+),score=217.97 TRINITY_DN1257_c0_g5_i1:41-1912(+)
MAPPPPAPAPDLKAAEPPVAQSEPRVAPQVIGGAEELRIAERRLAVKAAELSQLQQEQKEQKAMLVQAQDDNVNLARRLREALAERDTVREQLKRQEADVLKMRAAVADAEQQLRDVGPSLLAKRQATQLEAEMRRTALEREQALQQVSAADRREEEQKSAVSRLHQQKRDLEDALSEVRAVVKQQTIDLDEARGIAKDAERECQFYKDGADRSERGVGELRSRLAAAELRAEESSRLTVEARAEADAARASLANSHEAAAGQRDALLRSEAEVGRLTEELTAVRTELRSVAAQVQDWQREWAPKLTAAVERPHRRDASVSRARALVERERAIAERERRIEEEMLADRESEREKDEERARRDGMNALLTALNRLSDSVTRSSETLSAPPRGGPAKLSPPPPPAAGTVALAPRPDPPPAPPSAPPLAPPPAPPLAPPPAPAHETIAVPPVQDTHRPPIQDAHRPPILLDSDSDLRTSPRRRRPGAAGRDETENLKRSIRRQQQRRDVRRYAKQRLRDIHQDIVDDRAFGIGGSFRDDAIRSAHQQELRSVLGIPPADAPPHGHAGVATPLRPTVLPPPPPPPPPQERRVSFSMQPAVRFVDGGLVAGSSAPVRRGPMIGLPLCP